MSHPTTEHETDRVLRILQAYRCQFWNYDDDCGGMQLTDVLTPTGEATIQTGIKELESLADFIAGELFP